MALENYIIGASNTGAAGYHNAMAGMDQRKREAEADRHNAYIRQRDDQAYRDKMMREALEQASMAYSDEDGGETAYQGLANMSAQNGWPIPEKSFIVPVMKTLRGQYGDNLPSNVQEMQWIAQQGKFTPDEIAAQLRVEAGLKARAGQRLVRAPDGSVYLSDGSEAVTPLVTPQQAIEGAGLRAGTEQAAREKAKIEAIEPRAEAEAGTPLGQIALSDALRKEQEAELAQQQNAMDRYDVINAANDLSADPAIDRVYGTVRGQTYTATQESVDAEAKIARLTDLLTTANLGKMKGVLSDTDIKILERAGSILKNFRISPSLARQELKRVETVMRRYDEIVNPGNEKSAVPRETKRSVEDLVRQYAPD